jgi:2-iminobutanoate/2-iminopropanoate deaminase
MPSPPYTPVVAADGWLIVSGQVGVRDGALVEGGFRPQLEQALANLRSQLEGVGASLADVVKTTVFLVDMDDYPVMNEVYGDAFAEPRPARSALAVAGLPFGALVEIEAWAVAPG